MSNSDQDTEQGEGLEVFLNRIGSAIRTQLPGSYWVRAEVLKADLSKRNHFSLELASYGGEQNAKARAIIWASNINIVSEFERLTGQKITSGLKILFECSVQFRTDFGLSLVIHKIDARFTMGDMEAKLQAIRNRLFDLNEYNQNKRLSTPLDYTKVAVVSPKDAAGLGDFKTIAGRLERHGLCSFDYYVATFQGPDAANSIISSITQAVKKHQETLCYDALVLVRGGGDKAGLYELNEIRIARCVCRSPIPVLVGIGHDRDSTILDELANLRCATPSIVATTIQERIISNARNGKFSYQTLHASSHSHLSNSKLELKDYKQCVQSGSSRAIANWKSLLSEKQSFIVREPKAILQRARHQSHLFNTNISRHSINAVNSSRRNSEQLFHSLVHTAHKINTQGRHLALKHRATIFTSSRLALSKQTSEIKADIQRIKSNAKHQVVIAKSDIKLVKRNIFELSKNNLITYKRSASEVNYKMLSHLKYVIETEKGKLKLFMEKVLNLDPNNILERGFALVKDTSNKVITSASHTKTDEQVTIVFKDGSAKAKILRNQ